MSVVFVDSLGFTALSKRLRPDQVVAPLNKCYEIAPDAVFALDGTCGKAVGDQIMVFLERPSDLKTMPRER